MKLYVFFVLAIVLSEALGMSFRHKRQSGDDGDNNLDDRYGWDRPGRVNPPWQTRPPWNNGNTNNNNQNNGGPPQPTPVTNRPNRPTTQSSSVDACIRACPVTSEYNPVCGTNLVQYPNPGRLLCAQSCGVNVSLMRASPCPTATAAPAS
ncbi:uncharacterized protein LOC126371421 [Pectinophora gossypiella]|uniref:uncharacterized protein LOC126371421 n=1 Tax=Pectinophora gossypiella TaxID=13191 RepID=UPI00214EB6DB|nr:uncharacterized protein LOC126371421 [Pectinophora gossypiella]